MLQLWQERKELENQENNNTDEVKKKEKGGKARYLAKGKVKRGIQGEKGAPVRKRGAAREKPVS